MMNTKVRTAMDTCQRCKRAVTMAATNINTDGQWRFCTRHMRDLLGTDFGRARFQYVWPIFGLADATPAQRALFRDNYRGVPA